MAKKLLLENTTCGRCCGSGRYGPTSVYGGTCFGCNGSGVLLTKRGRAAQNLLDLLHTCRADELQVGQSYRETGVTMGGDTYTYWAKVTAIRPDGDGKLVITSASRYGDLEAHMGADTPVKYARSAEEVEATRVMALEFQKLVDRRGRVARVDVAL